MRSFFSLSLLSVLLTAVGFAQQTVVATSSGGAGGLGLYSDNTAWPTTGGFTFDVGVFPVGFDPATADRATWISAWLSARTSPVGAVTTWYKDGSANLFSINGSSALLRPADSPGAQYYVWGYNFKTTSGSAEWILLTNPAWRVVASDTPRLPDQFDTKDAGTVAIVGELSNGGIDLKSARVFATTLAISSQVASFSVPVGQPATLSVSARGAGLTYQWYSGTKGVTTSPIAGATKSSYTIGSLTTTQSFWVRVSSGAQSIDSETITVTADGIADGVAGTYDSPNLGYIAGQRVRISQRVTYTGTLTRLNVAALLPAGWSFLNDDSTGSSSHPATGNSDILEWTWSTVPASPVVFSYVLSVPAGVTGEQLVTTLATAMRAGVSQQSLFQPEPLRLKPGARLHTADIDHDNTISISELLRVIELYNTRLGNQRTGAYKVADGSVASEDGFLTDSVRSPADAVTLTSYHTADISPRDGRIGIAELTRVIELYNYRVGSTRTGAYYARGDTEDGFWSGVAP